MQQRVYICRLTNVHRSWTDRVLWKTSSIRVELLKYMCVNTITISDHKPVCAVFEAHTKRIDVAERDKLIQHLIKESDRKINEEMPHIVCCVSTRHHQKNVQFNVFLTTSQYY